MAAPNPKPKYIKWVVSEAKKIIIADLEAGILDVDAPSAKNAWDECYSKLAEFANVPFEQFQKRLADHRDQHQRQLSKATMEEILYERDKLMHTRQDRNNRGELVFDLHPAKLLLREDVESGENERMTPSDFQGTRPEYMLFKPNKFKERIYQEVKRKKYLYYLELKRLQEKKKRAVPIDDHANVDSSDMMQVEENS
jgi:hypothetical protein